MTSLARATAVSVLVAVLAGCTPETTVQPPPSTSSPTVVASATPSLASDDGPAMLPDGRHAAYLTKVDTPGRTVTFDFVLWLTGEPAKARWAIEHPEDPSGPPNDYVIVNNSPALRTLPVVAGVSVAVITPSSLPNTIPITFAQLPKYMNGSSMYWLTIKNAKVVAVEEQYRP
jgi:hypothetical protein